MKKKQQMFRTFKCNVFGKVTAKDGTEAPVVKIVDNRLVINEPCDLRTIRERYNPETKELAPSTVESILSAESFLTLHYGKRIGEHNTLFDFARKSIFESP